MKRWLLLLVTLIPMLAVAPLDTVRGQIEIEPEDDDSAYRVRVINETGAWIRVKMIGFRRDANYRIDLDDGDYDVQDLYGGRRVLCVWNRERELLLMVVVPITRSGKLRIRQMYGAAAAAEQREATEMPTLEIEEQ